MNVVEKYQNAENELFEYFGFEPGWVLYPIDTGTMEYYWSIVENSASVVFSNDKDKLIKYIKMHYTEDNKFSHEEYDECGMHVYIDEILHTIYYNKSIYKTEKHTMMICDPHVDYCTWLKIFDNEKEIICEIQ